MRKIVVFFFITMAGVRQAPLGPDEDPSVGFAHGGRTVPYVDEFPGAAMPGQMEQPFDLC